MKKFFEVVKYVLFAGSLMGFVLMLGAVGDIDCGGDSWQQLLVGFSAMVAGLVGSIACEKVQFN